MDDLKATLVRIPRGTMDGAVVELHQDDDGTMAAEIRIPGPAAP